jgi:gamma-glutamyltranspeptidase/glutathione hydrolase
MQRAGIKILLVIGIVLAIWGCERMKPDPYRIQQSLVTDKAMVVTAHPLASKIGIDVLKRGGNAVDAAVATQFALAVVYPRAGNIGGGGFMVIRTPDGRTAALDYREKAPAAAGRDMYLDPDGDVVDSLSRYGVLSAGVPGTVAGMVDAWKKYGRIPEWASLVEPAIALAKTGFRINQDEASRLNAYEPDFVRFNEHKIAFIQSDDWKTGDELVQADLAKTLQLIADQQEAGFYEGQVAAMIHTQMLKNGGLISRKDLREYRPVWREPITMDYRDYRVISMPPPSSGGIALGQLLKMVEPYDLGQMGLLSPEAIHLLAEAERRVYADRAIYLGDPDYYDVPDSMLLDSLYLTGRMKDFDPERATSSDSIREGGPILVESFETTHTSIVDPDGMAVSVTTTLNSNYGSKVVVPGAGFFLNNEMDDFSVKAGVANQFGLVGGEANAIEPGKRMLSSMSPTIVEKEGRLFMVLGSPGGSTIITSVLQVMLNVIDFGLNMTEAVRTPRFHHQWLPDQLIVERDGLDSLTIEALREKGHVLDYYDRIGLVKAILVTGEGRLEGVGDPRSFDDAEGY